MPGGVFLHDHGKGLSDGLEGKERTAIPLKPCGGSTACAEDGPARTVQAAGPGAVIVKKHPFTMFPRPDTAQSTGNFQPRRMQHGLLYLGKQRLSTGLCNPN